MIEEPYRWVEAIANRREYVEGQLAPGSPIAALGYREGILFVTLGQTRQKLFESTIESQWERLGILGTLSGCEWPRLNLQAPKASPARPRMFHYGGSRIIRSAPS